MTTKVKVEVDLMFRKDVIDIHRKQNKLTRLDPESNFTKQQFSRIRPQVLPEVIKNPVITTTRREQALNDPFNAITNAVMCIAQFNPTIAEPNGEKHELCLRISMDTTGIQLGLPVKNRPVYMSSGATTAMKLAHRSASRVTQDGETMNRTIKMMACSSGDGNLICAIHIVKDSNFKKTSLFPLGSITQNCDHYLLLTPCRPGKKELERLVALQNADASINVNDVEFTDDSSKNFAYEQLGNNSLSDALPSKEFPNIEKFFDVLIYNLSCKIALLLFSLFFTYRLPFSRIVSLLSS
jgi:hypothetical protein